LYGGSAPKEDRNKRKELKMADKLMKLNYEEYFSGII